METEQARVAHLLQEKGITCVIDRDLTPSEEHPGAIGWRVTFRYSGHMVSSLFYTEYKPPTPEQVMGTWMNEIQFVHDGSSYETWCDEKGFDPFEERSEQLYHKARRLNGYLEAFLGDDIKLFLYGS